LLDEDFRLVNMDPAILLIAHGSRLSGANADLMQIAAMLRERLPGTSVEFAYLELSEPTIPQGMRACISRGAGEVRMLPYFLSAGRHVQEDLERYRREFAQEYPSVRFTLCPPLGLHPKMIDILLDRLQETMDPDT
jgi:sirohydrochlorin ferrochelatase